MKPFRKAISQCNHLLVEGNSNVSGIHMSFVQNSFEALAVRYFRKIHNDKKGNKIHHLEDDGNIGLAQERFGFSAYEYLAMRVADLILRSPQNFTSGAELKTETRAMVEIICNRIPGYEVMNQNIIMDIVSNLRGYVARGDSSSAYTSGSIGFVMRAQDVLDVFKVYQKYTAKIRDSEIIIPALEKKFAQLRGVKGIVIGAAHMDAIQAFLEGKPVRPPSHWETFVDELSEVDHDKIAQVRRAIYK